MQNIWKKYAKVLTEYSLNVRKNDLVIIKGEAQAKPLIQAVYEEVLKKGAHPITRITLEGMPESYFEHSSDEILDFVDPFLLLDYERADKYISISAPYNVKNLARINPAKLARRSKTVKALSDILYKRSAEGSLRWVLCNYPCCALAQEAGMSLHDYEQLLFKACYLNLDDPVKKLQEVAKKQEKIVKELSKVKNIHITGYKTDLKLSVQGRTWLSGAGFGNLPDGEICSSPIENSTQGEIYFEYPSIYRGNEVTGIFLRFENGKVINATADKGEEFLLGMINQDEGARKLGEIAFGTNSMINDITGNILFDEKINSTIHLALGLTALGTGGNNQSAIHWDIVKPMKNGGMVYADHKLIYKNGNFII